MPKFQPGQSGNPSGRPKDQELRKLARARTKDAIAALVSIMKDKKAAAAARVSAAEAVLDRGWGRPIQATAFTDTEGNDRPLPSDDLEPLDKARRIAFLLGEGVRAMAAQASESESEEEQT